MMPFIITEKFQKILQKQNQGFVSPIRPLKRFLQPPPISNELFDQNFEESNISPESFSLTKPVESWGEFTRPEAGASTCPFWADEASFEPEQESKAIWLNSANDVSQPENGLELSDDSLRELSEGWPGPNQRRHQYLLNSETRPIKRKTGPIRHPEEPDIIHKFHLNDPDFQIEHGKILKTDQLSKNILRSMTRFDKRNIQALFSEIPKKKLSEDKQFRIIQTYFEQQYQISEPLDFNLDILRTLFSPLKTRQNRLVQEVLENKRVGQKTPGNKRRLIVNDRLQLLNGDFASTRHFFQFNPGRHIYWHSYVKIFKIYIQTLKDMNLERRARGFESFLHKLQADQ